MSRRVLMRAKMEDTLRANFQAAAARNFLPAATVLRQLMQADVAVQGGTDIKTSELTLRVYDAGAARKALAKLLSVVDFIRIEEVKGVDPSKDFIQTTDISGGHRLDGYNGTHFAVQPYIGLQMKRRMASRRSPSVG